jgi:three-Cys-motif partner protein
MEIPWVIEEQTKVKHQLLKNYINPWMAILFSQQEKYKFPQKLLYFDGFSGPGIYFEDDKKGTTCFGSPLIVADIANKYIEANLKREIIIICVDKEKKCVDMLSHKLKEINTHNQYWVAYHAEFDEAVNILLEQIEKKKLNTPPMFFFIDPFGYSRFPIKTLKRVLEYPLAELFINFMIYDIVRFCEEIQFKAKMAELFGCKEFSNVNACQNSEEKQSYLINLYCKQLRELAGASHIMPFRVNTPSQGTRPKYYLIHASKNIKALRVMKDNMSKISGSPYSFEAIGISPQISLFEDPNKISLRDRIKKYCKDKYPSTIDYTDIEEWAYANTNGVSKTIKEALLALEKEELIKVERKSGQRITTVTEGAKITFSGKLRYDL